jgi:hypothetical protein
MKPKCIAIKLFISGQIRLLALPILSTTHVANVLFTLALLMMNSEQARAAVIFDNTATRQDHLLSLTQLQIGSEVSAAGTARRVTDLMVGISNQGMAGTANFQARLYVDDGTTGLPGMLLWDGPVSPGVHLTGGVDLIDLRVPEVLVPDHFVWTVQITNDLYAGLPDFGPPTVGSSSGDLFGDGINWTHLTTNAFEARILAEPAVVPELGSAWFAASGGCLLLGAQWCRRTVAGPRA